mmetsp:Transcript_11108/g.22528  ORF Transcript_11108/g.22528 Transcript_11108/m.22528 type:complete len:324 (-) Transcript_11108:37-1008(-)
MAKLVDSLNYKDKFEFIDSDDEDYVEKVVMNQALTKSTDSVDVRNQAARALHKKGKHVPSQIDKTIRSTKTKMEMQLDELKAQMEALDRQTKALESIDNPEDALKFIENSGMKPEDIERMVKEAGFTEDDAARSKDVNQTVDKVTEVSSKIKDLATSRKMEEEPDSDDEVDDGAEKQGGGDVGKDGASEEEIIKQEEQEQEKKKISEFEAAFKKNQFNNAIAADKKEDKKVTTVKKSKKEAAFSAEYSDAMFSLVIELPGVSSMKSVDLQVSSTKLLLEAKADGESGAGLGLEYTFTSVIDESSLSAKFSKKKKILTVQGLLA